MNGRVVYAMAAALAAVMFSTGGHAQSSSTALSTVVSNCGTPPNAYNAGQNRPVTQDTTGTLCVSTGVSVDASDNPLVSTTSPTYADGTSNPPSATTKGAIRIIGCDATGACIADITAPSVVTSGKTIKTVSGTLTADTDVIAAVSSKRIKVIGYSMQNVGTNADICIFKSNGTGGTELWRMVLQGATGVPYGANMITPAPSFIFATVAGEKLTLDVNQSDTIHYSITYYDDDAL